MNQAALQPVLARLAQGVKLDAGEAEFLFEGIISGSATPAQIGAALMAMSVRGETVEELTEAVRVMRRHSVQIAGGADAIDCCGTGGDGRNTLNISTAVAFVVAAAGVRVAKHGNRAASSRSGTADVLALLGVKSDASPEDAGGMLARHGITFMYAPNHHPAMRAVGTIRRELGFRTLFNLVGPLANPAGARRQLIGVFDARWVEPVAETLLRLGSEAAWVVHGDDGLDELSISGPSSVAILKGGQIIRHTVTPEEAGLARAPLEAIAGGDPEFNAAALERLLEGERGAYRDIVLLNAAAALMVAERAECLSAGVALASAAIDSGGAKAIVKKLADDAKGSLT